MTTPRARPARRLPDRQPARALTAIACYLATTAAIALTLTTLTDSPVAVLLSIGIGMLLLVPLVVLAPRQLAPDRDPAPDTRPVLQRRNAVTPRHAGTEADGEAKAGPGGPATTPAGPA